MPDRDVVAEIGMWWSDKLKSRTSTDSAEVELVIPRSNLNLVDVRNIQAVDKSPFWRFRPSALLVETRLSEAARFHVLTVSSSAISLKDLGELNCYMRIIGASSGLAASVRGVSNEVRLIQADAQIRKRVFEPGNNQFMFAAAWSETERSIESLSVIPTEFQQLFES